VDLDDNHLERKNASQSSVFSEKLSEKEVSRVRKAKFFFIMIVWGILGVALASWARRGYRIEEEREVTSSREAEISVVKVYGPDVLTELAKRAIQEERPDVAIETYYEPLKNKVWIEGTTGAGYAALT
jgi:hypothetical protein